jgi:hypothetical protein
LDIYWNNFTFVMYVKEVVTNGGRKLKVAAPVEAVLGSVQ